MKMRVLIISVISIISALVVGSGIAFLSSISQKWMIAVSVMTSFALILLITRNAEKILLFGLAFLIPFSIGAGLPAFLERPDHIASWGTLDIQVLDIFIIILLMYRLVRWVAGRIKIRFYPFVTVPAIAWLLASSLSIAVAREPEFSVILLGVMAKMWLLYIVIANSIDETGMKWLVMGLLLGVLFQGLLGIYQEITGHPLGLFFLGEPIGLTYGNRSVGTIGHSNNYGMYLAATTPFALTLLFLDVSGIYKALASVVLCAGITGMLFSLSRGAWVSFILASIAVLIFAIRSKRQKLRVVLAGAGSFLLVFLLLTLSQQNLITNRLTSEQANESALSRIPLLRTGFEVFLDHPILGVGLNNYELFVPEYNLTSGRRTTLVHNSFVLVAAETGLVGLAAFLWFLASLFFQAKRLISRAPSNTVWLAGVGVFSGLIAISIHNTVDYGLLSAEAVFRLLWLFAAIAAGSSVNLGHERVVHRDLPQVGNRGVWDD